MESKLISLVDGHRLKMRKAWLLVMFLSGAFAQYLLAIYAPEVWNSVFKIITNMLTK
jgi:hypothetical protein